MGNEGLSTQPDTTTKKADYWNWPGFYPNGILMSVSLVTFIDVFFPLCYYSFASKLDEK